jgi:hypothetical protein
MNKLFLSAIVSLVVSLPSTAESSATKHHHGKSGAELATACEEHMNKVKDTGASLSPEWKAEFDYNLKLVAIEIEAMRDLNHKDSHKHSASCHRHLKAAERYVEKNLKKEERTKKAEERKAKAEERKAKPGVDHGKAESEVTS